MSNSLRTSVIIVVGLLMVSPLASAQDITVTVSEKTINDVAALMMPVVLRGKETVASVNLPVVGNLRAEVDWVAEVQNPQIRIADGTATFLADVALRANAVRYQGQVRGTLDVGYDDRGDQFIAVINRAILEVKAQNGGGAMKLDVSNRMPPIQLPVGFPNGVTRLGKKTVDIRTEPKVAFADGELVITSAVTFAAPGVRDAGEQPNKPNRASRNAELLERFDADRDGKLSAEERAAAVKERARIRGEKRAD